MGSGGGSGYVPPSAAEQQQVALQNQLLQQQLADAARQRAADAQANSPAALNAKLNATRTTQQADFNKSKTAAYQQARSNIIDQFTAFGDPSAAAPYLAALDQQYAGTQYHSGGEYSVGAPEQVTSTNFDATRYMASSPDVAQYAQSAATQFGGTPEQYALEHFQKYGQTEGRTYGAGAAVAPGADTWDDPNALLNTDYGAGDYLSAQRKTRKDTAYNTALNNAQTTLKGMGLDEGTYNDLWGLASNQFQTKYNSAGLSANDYSNAFDPQAVLDSVLGTARTAKRTQYGTAVNSAFGSLDPNQDFADTADDKYITDLVGKQYGDASSALDRAYKRGALTDTGYNAGLSYLGDQNKTAISTAQSLGGAVLQKNRDALSGVKTNAQTAASGWDLGQTFDVNKYLGDYTSKKSSLAGNLEGDITNALAGQNWFDVGDVLNKAGYAQGAQNTAPLTEGYTTPTGAAIAAAKDKDKTAQRGLGGVGVF